MRWLYPLLLAFPIALLLHWLDAPPAWTFAASGLAIIPLSAVLGRATEDLAAHTSATLGALLNATLGNAAELIITILALRQGLVDLVKASLTGSIIGNLLLVLGAALLAGGLRFRTQSFNERAAGMASAMLMLSVTALVIPALFVLAHPGTVRPRTWELSVAVAGVLIATYGASLVFTLRTHAALLGAPAHAGEEAARGAPAGSLRGAVALLAASTVGIAIMSELLVSTTEAAVAATGISEIFVGVVLVPVIGNAAEHASAVWMAARDKMDLAFGIAIGSSTQVALFVAPVLVFVALLFGRRMDFVFTPMEVVAVAAATAIVNIIARDGETNWFEGAQLLAVYVILAAAFYFY